MAEFYSARGWEIPPLPWTNLSPPFSPVRSACAWPARFWLRKATSPGASLPPAGKARPSPCGGLPASPRPPPSACSGSCRAATSGNPPGHGNPPPPSATPRSVLRPRPHAPRSRSARACSRSYSERQSRGELAGAASGDDQIPSSPSTSVRPDSKSSSRTAMRSTIARGVPCYQPLCRHSSRRDS